MGLCVLCASSLPCSLVAVGGRVTWVGGTVSDQGSHAFLLEPTVKKLTAKKLTALPS